MLEGIMAVSDRTPLRYHPRSKYWRIVEAHVLSGAYGLPGL
jgi:hypothetical protein